MASLPAPPLVIPVGYILVERDGEWVVERSDERLSKTVAFRLTPSEWAELMPFFDSFPSGSVTTAMRWLLSQEEVRVTTARHVALSRSNA